MKSSTWRKLIIGGACVLGGAIAAEAITGIVLPLTGNRQIIDTKYAFDKAIIINSDGNNACIVDIEKWNDYEDSEQIQLVLPDGTCILTSAYDTKLVNIDEDSYLTIEDIARAINGENTEISYLNNGPVKKLG